MTSIDGILLITIGTILGIGISLAVVRLEEWFEDKPSIPRRRFKQAIKIIRRVK